MQELKLNRLNKLREKGKSIVVTRESRRADNSPLALQQLQQNLATKVEYTSFIQSFIAENSKPLVKTSAEVDLA